MGKFRAEEADQYGGQGGSGFFSLKNDKDTAQVRFMYNTLDDIEGYAVHEIEVDGKKRYANCLRAYNEPIDNCPLCAAGYPVLAKFFIQLYDMETEEIKVWDRGKTFKSKLASLCSRYNPLVATPFEIERNGKKGDTSTTYETYAMKTDDTVLEDLPEVPEILGGLVLDKSADELITFLNTGAFDEEDIAPRRGSESRQAPSRGEQAPSRSVAASGRPATPASRQAAPVTRRAQSEVEEDEPVQPRRRPTGNRQF